MIPIKIGRYEIRAELGRGGMATVYRGYDPSFEREVAIKVLPREFLHDPQFHDRFRREIKTIAALEHPAIVPVYDVGEEDGAPYFVMRYMTGGSLSDWIEKGKFSLQDAARIIERVASALAYAHRKGIIHRDLKPDNILFDKAGDPFISDFGLATFAKGGTSLTGSAIVGTPAYMSPEQAQGEKVDNRSDIYGLGVIIFQMLSGRQPYHADTPMGVAVKHITEPVPEILMVNPGLPGSVDAIIKTAMAKGREHRYRSVVELAQALHSAASGGDGARAVAASGRRGFAPFAGDRRGYVIWGAAVFVIALVGVSVFRNQLFRPPQGNAATETLAATSTEALFAPACQPGIFPPIPTPIVRETKRTCAGNVAYITIGLPGGASFESLTPGFTCTAEAQQGNEQLVSCTGPESGSFELKACSPPPPVSSAEAARCPPDQIFDAPHQCCAAPPSEDPGCTVVKIELGSCSQ